MPGSADGREPDERKKKEKSRRPGNTAFRQQRLKAWQPILTPKTVLPLFFIVGVVFAPIGGLLLYASSRVQEVVIDYTECTNREGNDEFQSIPSDKYSSAFRTKGTVESPRWRITNETEYGRTIRSCELEFTIPNDFDPPIYFFYRLTNFYQNHRRYVKSLDEAQLGGQAREAASLKDSCSPLSEDPETGLPYYPCGLIANSLFNDTFKTLMYQNPSGETNAIPYNMTTKGIAWSSDRGRYKKTTYDPSKVMPPPNWRDRFANYTEDNIPDISDWEELQVWMRTAGLPTFSKLAMRNDTGTMKKGVYRIKILDKFPVKVYGGTKSVVISTTTVMGGKNPFLGIAYIVVGGLCVLLGAIFAARHLIKPRKLGDHTYLSWNNEPSTATATGRDNRGDHA